LTAVPDKTNQMKLFKDTLLRIRTPRGMLSEADIFREYLKVTVVYPVTNFLGFIIGCIDGFLSFSIQP